MADRRPSHAIATPALVIDEAVLHRNLDRTLGYARSRRLELRPHIKTHKSLNLAQIQMEKGACGLAAAQIREIEIMAGAADDLLLTGAVVEPTRCRRLAQLGRRATVRVAVDSVTAIEALKEAARHAGSTLSVLIEMDVGLRETGAQSAEQSLELAKRASASHDLRLDGLLFYVGPIVSAPLQQMQRLRDIDALLKETLELWRGAGLVANIVSGGGSALLVPGDLPSQLTELRPGTSIFWDADAVAAGYCSIDDCAARMVCTVVSDTVRDQVVVNAGSKALSSASSLSAPEGGYGIVVEYPEARVRRLSETQAQVDMSACVSRPRIGERLMIVPKQIGPCVNLQDRLWLQHDDGSLEQIVVDARGDA